MINTTTNKYQPDYLVAPGEVLEEYLENLGMTQAELSSRTGLARKTINEIVKGKSPLTPETALKLERTLGRPAHFWNNLEQRFQEDKIRLADKERLKAHLDWLRRVPVRAMIKQAWIPDARDKVSLLEEVLSFFGVASPEQWEAVWQGPQAAYRKTDRFEAHNEAISAWLRKGELKAHEIPCARYNNKRFQDTLTEIRNLTRETPQVFQRRLVELCALAGVAVVFVPELPKTGVYGATRWLGDKAVIQLSLRYKSNDHLWFTFFHEAGHILLHGRKDIFIEGKDLNGVKEDEANRFAAKKLIPAKQYQRFLDAGKPSLEAIRRFANSIGIAPGIVVGRLQHDDVLQPNTGNNLKVFYTWV